MKIRDCFQAGHPVFSFEFFPPKTPQGLENLYTTVHELAELKPSFVSVTYGAGGSNRAVQVELTSRIKREIGVETMAHLTCVGHSATELAAILDQLRDAGMENILALRGDPPQGQTAFVKPADGFGHAQDLARFIRSGWDFCLGGACYPEGHPESPNLEEDLHRTREKVDAGVDFLVTQLFFEAETYFRYVERARAVGIEVPIVPGIMPVTNVGQLERFTTLCGASIPPRLRERLEGIRDDEEAVVQAGVTWATEQCRALLDGGAPGIHFYTLNRSRSTRIVFQSLGVQRG